MCNLESLDAERIEINSTSEVNIFHLKTGINSKKITLFAFVYQSRETNL